MKRIFCINRLTINWKGGHKMSHLEKEIEVHYVTLLKIAYIYVKNREMAEDIVQDVCEKAIQKADMFRGEASYKTYLIRMTINRAYDYLRSWKYKQLSLTSTFVQLLHLESPEKKALQKDENTQLGLQILKLTPKYREVITLYYYEEFSVQEIAQILTLPEGTIKTRLKRGRDQLKKKLKLEGVELDA